MKKPDSIIDESSRRVSMPSAEGVSDFVVMSKSVLVYRIMPSKVSKGGIIVPVEALSNNEVEYPHTGVAMVVGDMLSDKVEYGDFIYYNQFGGRYLKDESSGVEYILLGEGDIMAVKKGFDGYKDGVLNK